MKQNFFENKIFKDVCSGLTAAMLVGSYSICLCSILGFGLWQVLFCCVICFLLSIENKNAVFSPDAFLLLPVLYIVSSGAGAFLPVAAIISVLIATVLNKVLNRKNIPDYVFAGGGIGLALTVTIIITNNYFGIGAFGTTALEMLKSYRSLGFHPDFRGLLYGTVTLFAMITYPFKFRKLNKHLPAEFMTLLVPLILNLFLNPVKELTTINEISTFNRLNFNDLLYDFSFDGISNNQITATIKASVVLGILIYLYLSKNDERKNRHLLADFGTTFLSGLPVRTFHTGSFSVVSAITAIVATTAVIFFFPHFLSRIPEHCVGALLIVSAWQNIPYNKIAAAFKENSIVSLVVIIASIVIFIVCDLFIAVILCLLMALPVARRKIK